MLRSGYVSKRAGVLVQECGKGLVELRIDGERLFFRLPVPIFATPDAGHVADAAAALRIAPTAIERAAIVDVGPVWLTVQLRDARTVLHLDPDMAAIEALSRPPVTGLNVFGFHNDDAPADVEVRSFAPADGVPEDPVCGSGNGCVAAMIQRERLPVGKSYVSSQGTCVRRDGRIDVRFEDGAIWIGGHAITCIEGALIVSAR
jgi:PhzF family phenazine biosynthesis protein